MGFDYFYNREAERFLFYRILHVFFEESKFKALSSDAKILYVLFFHRIMLSLKKGWVGLMSACKFCLTVPYSEERRMSASEAAKKTSVNGMGRSVHKNLL